MHISEKNPGKCPSAASCGVHVLFFPHKSRGAALVEMALVLPLLLLLLLGILEFGVVMMHQLTLGQIAREGSRMASLGRTVEQIDDRIGNLSDALPNPQELDINLNYSLDEGATFDNPLEDIADTDQNDAPPGSLIEVTITWPHPLLTGNFFSWLTGAHDGQLPLKANVVMRRE